MKITLIGYGKMGKTIEKIALQRAHNIVEIIDIGEESKFNSETVLNTDIAIEFTNPQSAENNIKKCLENGISVVSGTTGWNFNNYEIEEICVKNNCAFFYASNFSIGMNIFFEINKKLAQLLSNHQDYTVQIEETHHIHKLDKPSGTAITLATAIIENSNRYQNSELDKYVDDTIPIKSFRVGEIVGEHNVIWDSEIDTISIEHSAKSRDGFAIGAILAAEFLKNKIGVFSMQDLLF